MSLLDTPHKRKSASITTLLLLLLLFIMANYGMRYFDPPEEYGVAISVGDFIGSADTAIKSVQQQSIQKVEEQQEVVEEVEEVVAEVPEKTNQEEVLVDDEPTEVSVEENLKSIKEEPLPAKEQPTKEVTKPKPTPSKEVQGMLESLLNNNSSGGSSKGAGDDQENGIKGANNGTVNSSKYYGLTGDSDSGDYNLAGRKALSKPKQQPDCEEEGIVVVRIEVNQKGEVIKATPGVKGSTNTAACLLKPSKEAALQTTWNVDKKAPFKQVGNHYL